MLIAYDGNRWGCSRPRQNGSTHEDQEKQTLDENSTPQPDTEKKDTGKKSMKIDKKTAVVSTAIGIGSAAIVAALLYASRSNKS